MRDASTDNWITSPRLNSLRGFACILLVLDHTMLGSLNYLKIDSQIWNAMHQIFTPIRMPLFSLLSGIVYAYRPASFDNIVSFMVKKARRLLIPMVVITILMIMMKMVVPSNGGVVGFNSIPYYLTHEYEHLWFLQSLFVIFFIIALADSIIKKNLRLSVDVVLFISSLAFFMPHESLDFFSFSNALMILPFFVMGVAIKRFEDFLGANRFVFVAISLGLGAVFFSYLCYATYQGNVIPRKTVIGFLVAVPSLIFIVMSLPKIPFLGRIGIYSYSIYLFHPIISAVANRISPNSIFILAPVSFLMALFVPIIIEIIIVKYVPVFNFVIGKPVKIRHGPIISSDARSQAA